MALRLLIALAGCSCLFITPSAQAQRTPGDAVDQRAVREAVYRVEEQQRRDAAQWALQRRLPLRLPQADGTSLQLVGTEGTRPIYLIPHNEEAAAVTGTRLLHPGGRLGLGLTGAGMQIGIWDQGGVLATHQEFEHRVVRVDGAVPRRHSTGVAGTLAAAGLYPEVRGMAYRAGLRSYDWVGDIVELLSEAEQGLLLSNHSYGSVAGWYYGDVENNGAQWYWFGDPSVSQQTDYTFGRYSSRAAQFDRVAASNPYLLPVLAAGNHRGDTGPREGPYRALNVLGLWQTYTGRYPEPDGGPGGYDTIAGMAVAKNGLTVGAIEISTPGGLLISAYSSFGPTDDGRVKPDLVGYGARVLSTYSLEADAYATGGGTSVATANVAGSLLLLQEYHHDLTGTFMRAASLKGLAAHTAHDLGPPGPDYQYGWGLLDAEAAANQLSLLAVEPSVLAEPTLEEGYTHLQPITVAQDGPLRVTLSWTDPPSSPLMLNGAAALNADTPHLRNDLDLRIVEGETGETFYPYVLDPSNPGAPAGYGDNAVDPIEQVHIAHAAAGEYLVVISHKAWFGPGAAQPFSVLISGASGVEPAVAIARLEAEAIEDVVALTWQARSEREQGTFLVERKAVRGDQRADEPTAGFELLATLPVRASAEAHPYVFRDEDLPPGHYFYRLVYRDGDLRQVTATRQVSVLPLLFSRLQASLNGEAVELRWETLAERDQAVFLVERADLACGASPNNEAVPFTHRATLPAREASPHTQTYSFLDATIRDGCYRYRVSVEDQQALYVLDVIDIEVPVPRHFAILSNYPNPFRDQTRIVVDLVYPYKLRGGHVRLDVYDIVGRRVARLYEGSLLPGRYAFLFDASLLAPGAYFARVVLDHNQVSFNRAERILTHPLIVME